MAESRAAARSRKNRTGFSRISPSRIAWVRTKATQTLAINQETPEEIKEKYEVKNVEVGDAVYLSITVPGRTRPLVWDFTGMTGDELDAVRKFFIHLFDLADPVVRERDRVAQDALRKGDDSYDRVYREVPTLVMRPRQERTDGESLQHRSEDATGDDGSSSDLSGGLLGSGDGLADEVSGDSQLQDDRPENDLG